MNPDRWERVKQLLEEAVGIGEESRDRFLKAACAGDAELRREVESLLQAHEQADAGFLKNSAVNLGLAAAAAPARERIGPYEIIEEIGHGGMGEVYRAVRVDGQYNKAVAIKLVPGAFTSAAVAERFRNERQILASLEHPNIARLLDGGTTASGLPYLVMELIEGIPIDRYCDENRLSVSDRLQLFRQVCAAVRFAHQRLVIHRDIKPANILVTSDGTPKLLDFGIAKIMDWASDAGSEATLTAYRPLTLRYASPEQIIGTPMATTSDAYSMGVVLYELLTGRSPYRLETGSASELSHAICHTEPLRPSVAVRDQGSENSQNAQAVSPSALRNSSVEKLSKRLSGDLDNIVLMALRKEPSRRYPSVEQFDEDIRRHLENLPVIARKNTFAYGAAKFFSRHRASVLTSAVAVGLLLGGLTAALYEARVARLQRARAERRFDDVKQLAHSLMFDIHDSIRDLPGSLAARKLIVNRALQYLDSLSQEAGGDAALQQELASAYERVGDLLGYTGSANLGDFQGALDSYKKAVVIREEAAAAHPSDVKIRGDLLSSYFRLSFALQDGGDFLHAIGVLNKGLPVAEALARSNPEPKYQDWWAGFYWQLGNVRLKAGEATEALHNFERSTAIREPIASAADAKAIFRTHWAADYVGSCKGLWFTGDLDGALEACNKGIQLLKQLSQADPTNATLREYLGEALIRTGALLNETGDLNQALVDLQQAHQLFEGLAAAEPSNSLARNNLGFVDVLTGRVLSHQAKFDDAMAHIRRAITLFEGIAAKNRYDSLNQALAYAAMGQSYSLLVAREQTTARKLSHLQEAAAWYRKSLFTWREGGAEGVADYADIAVRDRTVTDLAKCEAEIAGFGKAASVPR